MTTATLTTLELDFNSRVYVQRVIYTYMKNNNLTELQTSTYDALIDLFQDATIWISDNERAIVSALISKVDFFRTDITDVQRENVKRVFNTISKVGA